MNALLFSLVLLGCVACGINADCSKQVTCLQQIKDAAAQKDVKQACTLLKNGGDCIASLTSKCPEVSSRLLNTTDIKIDNLELGMGCDGNCAKQMDPCLAPIAKMLSPNSTYTFEMCNKVTESLACLKKINAPNCTDQTKQLVTFVATTFKKQDFSDLCGDDNKPAKCYTAFNKCFETLGLIKSTKDVDNKCKLIDSFLECQSKITCKSVIKKFADQVRNGLETTETKAKCPTVGTCNERMTKCANDGLKANKAAAAQKNNSTLKAAECKLLKRSNTCFDAVRKDTVCSLDAAAITSVENQVKELLKPCGATSLMVSSILVIMGAVTAMLKNHL